LESSRPDRFPNGFPYIAVPKYTQRHPISKATLIELTEWCDKIISE